MSQIGRVLQENEANGVVYNAKGDVANPFSYNIVAVSLPGLARQGQITLNPNGTMPYK